MAGYQLYTVNPTNGATKKVAAIVDGPGEGRVYFEDGEVRTCFSHKHYGNITAIAASLLTFD